ncbi:DUF5723 family protein [Siphonobacter sp. SORGH_AS_1065]|uniref:DUF5723 family protein n=1 Tax=Siphonobacter sp. SORGH_AS_1065 TaxID=3041795 RepID=UPI002782E448|nr:DUF5723 family protein [Siphonobacter sp. SORGH_AS_1065]MDQ1088307.1 hypothetical protein [Siphonobacter sp. SORGH_AS_1065]
MKKYWWSIFLAGLPLASFAQNFNGFAHSTSAGIHNVYTNPALIAGSKYKLHINLFAGNANVYNNYAEWVGPYKLNRLIFGGIPQQYLRSDGRPALQPEYFRENLDGKPKNGTGTAEIRGPGLLVALGPKHSIALTTRARASAQAFGVSENLLSLVRQGFDFATLWNIANVDNKFSINGNIYGEVALTYGATMIEAGPHTLKGGITAKKIVGFYSAHVRNRDLRYRVIEDPERPGKGLFVMDNFDADFGYTLQEPINDGVGLRKFLGQKMPGSGWGFDLGFAYEYNAEEDESGRYNLRLSASVMDVGTVRYEDPSQIRGYTILRSNKTIRQEDFDNVKGSDELVRLIESKMELQPSEAKTSFVTGLPMALNTNADLRLSEEIFVNVSYIKDLRSVNALSARQPTVFSVTPRWESASGLEIAVPLNWMFNTFSPGIAMRLGPIFAGTDNMVCLFSNSRRIAPRGMDVYAGLSVPLFKRKPRY